LKSLCSSPLTAEVCNEYINILKHLITYKGDKRALELMKAYRLQLQQVILDQPVQNIPFHTVIPGTNVAKVLQRSYAAAKGELEDKRTVLSVWRVTESFRLKIDEDLSSITDPGVDTMYPILDQFKEFLRTWSGLSLLKDNPFPPRLVLSNKAGPNGPATLSAMKDLYSIKNEVFYNDIRRVSKIINLEPDAYLQVSNPDGKSHSKIVALADKGGKTRLIAIAD
jgi:hypothetical protein